MPEVLVIDDNLSQLHAREAVLRDAGFSVVTASSAEQALDWLNHNAPNTGLRLILTDHVLPGASGAGFVRELRKIGPDVPVFVITGMEEAAQEYVGLNVTFLQKPCSPEELIARIREAIAKEQ